MAVDRSKVGKRSRQKGASFERRIAKLFSKWLDCDVRRTPMSGAYGSEWSLGGDLMFKVDVPWYVELKNRESWRLEQLFAPEPCGPVLKWLESTWKEAERADKTPMLIFGRNRVDPYVAIPGFHLECDLNLRDAVMLPTIAFIPDGWIIAPLETLIDTISKEAVLGWRESRRQNMGQV